MADNVIRFPKIRLDAPPQTLEEVTEKIIEYKKNFTDELSEILWNNVLGELARAGADLDTNSEELFPSMVLLLETIRSLHLHSSGVYHPLQDFAVECFENDSEEEDSEMDIEVVLAEGLSPDATIDDLKELLSEPNPII